MQPRIDNDAPQGPSALAAPAPAHNPADDAFEDRFHQSHPLLWWATLLGPFVTTISLLAAFWVYNPDYCRKLVAAALGTFFLLGRFVILLGEGNGEQARLFYAWELVAMVVYMDLVVAILLSSHLSFVYRLPRIGAKLRELEADGRFILAANPWMRRTTLLGVVAFVMFPLAATGSIGGSIFGRLLGMSRIQTLMGVATGSILGCGLMFFGAAFIDRLLGDYPLARYVGSGVFLLGFIWVLNDRYRKLKAARR